MALVLRKARQGDATAISALIISAIKQTNAKDYPAELIESLPEHFSAEQVAMRMSTRDTYVALDAGVVIATASLDDMTVRSVFVLPEYQGRGAGLELMMQIEALALQRSISTLNVPSSITAEGFYKRLGYTTIREVYEGAEKIIVMSKTLDA
ncbi:GNAT family N-acetyltransferase [Pseudomonas sp. RL_15y_Pfl2_60]|uniref:GNAT family N-acetyltransferase n=1 Tax=Pseudomonas sp. RL_15y_Pfl2_60 TaxID=3088709 RepID=UPI0030D9CDA8